MFAGAMGKISVFCSYAREDEAIRRALEVHLAALRRERIIDDWYDNRIQPATRWDEAIGARLERAQLMLFIVTPDLMASKYVASVEIPKAIERELRGECQVLPIMAREADWNASPLAQFQAIPGGGRWIEDYSDPATAYGEITAGVREVCRRIVDWENPYIRAQVGDWTWSEQTMTTPNGQSATAQGTEELVEKSRDQARLLLEIELGGQIQRRTVSVDLGRPLEERMGDIMRQTGAELPANVEISMGPAHYDEQVINIGGRRYETVHAQRDIALIQRGQRLHGWAATWRSIDVPLYGAVKGEGNLGGMHQYQVLLDFGHGDAAARKPRLGGASAHVGGAGSSQLHAPNPMAQAPVIVPGRWLVSMDSFGQPAAFDLMLYPNGALAGQQNAMGILSALQGQWWFDPNTQSLTVHVMTSMMGVPTGQETVQIWIGGLAGNMLQGQDALGRSYRFQRVG